LPCRHQYQLALEKFDKKKYTQAINAFKVLVFNCPGATMVDTAQYFLGMSYYQEKDYPTAAGEFRKLLNSFPTSDFADDALFMLGLSDYQQSPGPELDQTYTLQALEHFLDFLDIYPASPRLPEVREYIRTCRDKLAEKAYLTAWQYFRMKDYEPTRIYCRQVLQDYPDSKWAAKAQFLMGETYRKESQNGQAVTEYQKVLDDYQDRGLSDKSRRRIAEIKGSRPENN
jgi:outer membrane protein assembly factor BamD